MIATRARSAASVVTASSPEAEKADTLQLENGAGPWLVAMTLGEPVVVDDVDDDERWRGWLTEVAELGFRSALSLRLSTSRAALGAVTLYAAEPGAFGPKAVDIARLYGPHASVAMAFTQQASGLRRAIDARHTIGQAQGILMERHGLDAGQAFAALRRRAQDRGVPLSEYAAMVISGRGLTAAP